MLTIKKVFGKRTKSSRTILIGAILIFLFLCGCSPKPRVYRIGILSGADTFMNITDGFKAKMTELGYKEGANVNYDFQKLDTDPVNERRIAEKLIANKVDLILAFPTEPALIAKTAALKAGIPVVFAMGTIEETGLVESVRHPGGNITGVRFNGPDLLVKEFEILLELAPHTKRVWIIYDTKYPAGISTMEVLRPFAVSKKVVLVETHVGNKEDLDATLKARARLNDTGIDAIKMIPDIVTLTPDGFELICKFAMEHRIPISGGILSNADQGGFFSYMPDYHSIGKQAASLVDKILKGSPAGTIPVVSPEPYLRINYKTAQRLGLNVPEDLLSQANEVIR